MNATEPEPEPEPEPFSIRPIKTINTHLRSGMLYFFLLSINFPLFAQDYAIESTQIELFYQEIVTKIDCGAGGLHRKDFYELMLKFQVNEEHHHHYYSSGGYYSSGDNSNPGSNTHSSSSTHSSDSNNSITYIRDTVFMNNSLDEDDIPSDTVFLQAEVPSNNDMLLAQKALKKIIEEEGLQALIQETVSDLSANELQKFKKELKDDFKAINSELKIEQAERKVAELEAKREARKEARRINKARKKEEREAWKGLSKEEKRELLKAKTTLIVHETGQAAGAAAAAVGGAVATVVSGGVIAIGQGFIQTSAAIWNWLEDHFYLKIDLSCAQQKKIKKYRLTHNYRPKAALPYRGNCPSW